MADNKTQEFTWIGIDEALPDSDMTVMICQPYSTEPVWLGFLDGDTWMSVEANFVDGVTHWAYLPEPMEAR